MSRAEVLSPEVEAGKADDGNREVEAVPGGKIRMHLLISLNLRMRL